MTTNNEIALGFQTRLPPLHGGAPPSECPVCRAKQVPPESDEGIPPPEQHEYYCGATYLRPEDEPGPWEPCRTCGRAPSSAAAAWIRDLLSRRGFAAAATALHRAVDAPPLFEIEEGSPLDLAFGGFRGERPPEQCPSCGAAATGGLPSLWKYACGSSFWATSTRPTPTGPVAMSWQGSGDCSRAPLHRLLEVLHASAQREGNSAVATASAEALRRLGDSGNASGGNGHPGGAAETKGLST